MRIQIENEALCVQVETKGAEVVSVVCKDSGDDAWEDRPAAAYLKKDEVFNR